MHRSIIALSALALVHCADPDEDESPEVLALRAPRTSDHGVIALGSSMETELTRAQAVHTWQFTLPDRAEVTLYTEASVAALPGARDIDTVLVLRSSDGRWLAQNDDSAPSRYSRIVRTLPAGDYQAQVHGYAPSVRGRFAFVTACAGAGCPVERSACFFGDTFNDLRAHPTLVGTQTWITSAAQLPELERTQAIVAVQQSSHTDVSTIEEALAVIDEQKLRRLELHHPDGRVFLAFEYGVGDNSYGAVFAAGSASVLASIHDGDLLDCAL